MELEFIETILRARELQPWIRYSKTRILPEGLTLSTQSKETCA